MQQTWINMVSSRHLAAAHPFRQHPTSHARSICSFSCCRNLLKFAEFIIVCQILDSSKHNHFLLSMLWFSKPPQKENLTICKTIIILFRFPTRMDGTSHSVILLQFKRKAVVVEAGISIEKMTTNLCVI